MNALSRLNTLSTLWDTAAEALSRHDYPAFDQAMSKFREISREPARANNALGSDK